MPLKESDEENPTLVEIRAQLTPLEEIPKEKLGFGNLTIDGLAEILARNAKYRPCPKVVFINGTPSVIDQSDIFANGIIGGKDTPPFLKRARFMTVEEYVQERKRRGWKDLPDEEPEEGIWH